MGSATKISRQQIVVICVCVGIFALGQFHRASGSIFTPILMDRFALSAATIGGLVSAMYLSTIVVQIPFGVVLDRTGPRRVVTTCILLVAAGTIVFALANGFQTALLARVLIGIGMASMGAATHVIIARNFEARDFGYISGLVVTLGSVGGLMGTYPLAVALERLPWHLVFGAIAGLTVVLAALVFPAIRPGTVTAEPQEAETAGTGYLALLRRPEIVKILALSAVTFAPITTITGLWGGPYLQDVVGLSAENAGAALFTLFTATVTGSYVFGLLDRRAPSRRTVILTGVSLSTLSLTGLALVGRPGAGLSIALLLAMIFCQQFYIPLSAHMRKIVPDHMLGRASTLLTLVAVAAIPVMQIGFGTLLDLGAGMGLSMEGRYRIAFAAMAGMIALCGLVYATAREADSE